MDEGDEEDCANVSVPSPSKKRLCNPTHQTTGLEDSLEEGFNCSICFEPYTNSGTHRLTCLKCGHLFGKSCIKKWLTATAASKHSYCPQCKTKAKVGDIRDHYCRGIKVLDTLEKEEALNELQKERESKRSMQIELATLRQKYDSLETEMKSLKQQVTKTNICSSNVVCVENFVDLAHDAASNNVLNVAFMKRLEVCREGESRVMSHFPLQSTLAVSARQNTALFNPCGLKKIDLHVTRCTEFVPIHTDVIRDIKTDGYNALTASVDKCLVLSSMHNNVRIQKWNLNQRIWACAFKTNESHFVFAATQNGKVKMFDCRMVHNDQEDESVVEVCDFKKPIFSLNWIENVSNSSGLLVTSIDRCVYYAQASATEFEPHVIPAEGKLYSMSYNNSNNHFMISYGPSTNKRTCVEHSLYALTRRSNTDLTVSGCHSYTSNFIRSFNGGSKQTLMCRNLLFDNSKDPSAKLLAAVYDETSTSLQLWDMSSGAVERRVPLSNDTLYDIGAFAFENRHYLCLLNNKYLSLNVLQ